VNVDDFRRFCADYDVQICVLSRARADVLAKYTNKLVQNYKLFYCGENYDRYEYRCTERIAVPPEFTGRSMVANHVMRLLPNKVLIILPDDIKDISWMGGDRSVRLDDEGFMVLVVNVVVSALDLKVGLFGITENDIRKTSPLAPFHTRAMVTGFVGINRHIQPPIWFDERQKVKEDYDFALEFLKRDRLVWKDCRYFFSQDRNVLRGGNMPWRTPEREEQEVQNLKDWWGSDMIVFTDGKNTKHLRVSL
jgi:hypothetical protein